MGLKRDKLDKVFSDLVRESNDWTCQKCGKYYPEGHRQGLHCSHLYSRRNQSTRFYAGNAFAHCFSCHQYLGGHPVIFAEWAQTELGDELYEEVRQRHHQICKRTKAEKEELYKHLKAQLAYLQRRRKEGQTGKITVMEWD